MSKHIYEIDGNNFSTLEEFAVEFTNKLNLSSQWNGNLDAFNDILHGGFGTPEEGFTLLWKNSAKSKEKLGYAETVRQLEKRLLTCHPNNRIYTKQLIEQAKQNKSSTVFDWLIEIINDESHKDIEIRLQ